MSGLQCLEYCVNVISFVAGEAGRRGGAWESRVAGIRGEESATRFSTFRNAGKILVFIESAID